MPQVIPTSGPQLTALKRTFHSHSGHLECAGGYITVTHHAVDVVSFDARRIAVTLRNGGWNSVTTRQRINKALSFFGFPLTLTSRKYVWYVRTPYGEVPFVDGMRLTGDGFPLA